MYIKHCSFSFKNFNNYMPRLFEHERSGASEIVIGLVEQLKIDTGLANRFTLEPKGIAI